MYTPQIYVYVCIYTPQIYVYACTYIYLIYMYMYPLSTSVHLYTLYTYIHTPCPRMYRESPLYIYIHIYTYISISLQSGTIEGLLLNWGDWVKTPHMYIYRHPMFLCWLSRTTVGTWLLVRELSPAYVGHSQKSIHVSYYMYIYTYILNTYMYIYRRPLFQCWLVTSPVGTWLLERGLSPAYSYVGATKEGCGGLWEHAYHQVSRGGGLGSRPKKMYGERLGDGVEYHLMKPTPRC